MPPKNRFIPVTESNGKTPIGQQALLHRQQSLAGHTFRRLVPLRPLVCPAPDGGFFAVWSTLGRVDDCEIVSYTPPHFNAFPRTSLRLSSKVHCLTSSSTRRLLGVGNAGTKWTAEVWDLSKEVRILQVPTGRFISFLDFTPDESHLVTISEEGAVVTHVQSAAECLRITIPTQVRLRAAFHPSGLLITSGHNGCVSLIDVTRGAYIKSVYPGGFEMTAEEAAIEIDHLGQRAEKQYQAGWEDRMRAAHMQSAGALGNAGSKMLDLEIAMIKDALTKLQQGPADFIGARGNARITSLTVSPCGNWIGCGTETGAFVLAWSDIEQSADGIITPTFGSIGELNVCEPSSHAETVAGYTQIGGFDTANNEYIFAGEDGIVRMLNLETGINSCLPATRAPLGIVHMEVSTDGSSLCCVRRLLRDQQQPWILEIWDYRALYEQRVSSQSRR